MINDQETVWVCQFCDYVVLVMNPEDKVELIEHTEEEHPKEFKELLKKRGKTKKQIIADLMRNKK